MEILFVICVMLVCAYLWFQSQKTKQFDRHWKAAQRGKAESQHNIGVCYYNGVHVTRDYGEAVKWWRLAADQGLADAQYNLGLAYSKGEGVPQDIVDSIQWMQRAAAQGYTPAMQIMDMLANEQNDTGLIRATRWT